MQMSNRMKPHSTIKSMSDRESNGRVLKCTNYVIRHDRKLWFRITWSMVLNVGLHHVIADFLFNFFFFFHLAIKVFQVFPFHIYSSLRQVFIRKQQRITHKNEKEIKSIKFKSILFKNIKEKQDYLYVLFELW